MCGIVGKLTWAGGHEPPEVFDRAVELIAHRGPDDRGAHHETIGDVRISLGHTRLSILDLSPAGHQPMFSPRTGNCVVFNGEVYNFRELRPDLESAGMRFTTECDTEVVLASYDRYGDRFVDPFRGMFAIAMLDKVRGRLVLARDRLGIKPLYYYWDGRQLAFASELTALLAFPSLELNVSQEAIRQYLLHGYIPNPMSAFERIRKLPAGHLLTCDLLDPNPREQCYWDALSFYQQEQSYSSEEEVLEAIDEKLREAVKLRLISDVPLGTFLSGGVDSTLVAALMRQVHSGTVRTFTVGFTVPEWNEAPAAKRIAEHLGAEHEELYLSEDNVLDVARHASEFYDEPFADESNIPTLALSRMTRRHVTVALSGDGGDELFWGYARYDDRYIRAYDLFRAVPRPLRRMAGAGIVLVPSRRLQCWRGLMGFREFSDYYLRPSVWRPWLQPALHRDAGRRDRLGEIGRSVAGRLRHRERDVLMGVMDLKAYLVDDILTKVDRASMSVALEVRVPLIDHHVVQLAAGVPSRFRTANGELKHLLKSLLSRYVPDELWRRPKKGFGVPLVHWLKTSMRTWAYDELTSRETRLHEWLDADTLRRIMDEHVTGKSDHARLIWTCLQLAGWDRRMTRIRRGHALTTVAQS